VDFGKADEDNPETHAIHVSPSNPVIFGDGKGEESGYVKIMLTPPTPAKQARVGLINGGSVRKVDGSR